MLIHPARPADRGNAPMRTHVSVPHDHIHLISRNISRAELPSASSPRPAPPSATGTWTLGQRELLDVSRRSGVGDPDRRLHLQLPAAPAPQKVPSMQCPLARRESPQPTLLLTAASHMRHCNLKRLADLQSPTPPRARSAAPTWSARGRTHAHEEHATGWIGRCAGPSARCSPPRRSAAAGVAATMPGRSAPRSTGA